MDKGSKGIWIKQMNEDMKRVKVVKRRGQKEHLKQSDEQNKSIYYNKINIGTLKISLILLIK